MSGMPRLTRSLIGAKVVMAVTGVIFLLFVLLHMLGNLHFFQGAAEIDAYAAWLRKIGTPGLPYAGALWIVRAVLIAAVVAHLAAAWRVTVASRAARPVAYRRLVPIETTYAARTMRWGGVIILLFVIYHLLDLTFGVVNPGYVELDVYRNVVASFARWPVALAYIVAMLALALHIYHGVYSACQTLGVNFPRINHVRRPVALVTAVVIAGGFVAVPVAVLAGVGR